MNIEYSDNQDHIQVYVENESGKAAFILCDGMGGWFLAPTGPLIP